MVSASRRAHGRLSGAVRRARLAWRRFIRRLALSNLFLIAAVVVVAIAMVALGNWIGLYLANSISRGVAETAASSIEALVATPLSELGPERPLSAADRATLDRAFLIGNDAGSTRLLQIRIRDLEGVTIYESFGGIINTDRSDDFAAAVAGRVVSRVSDLPLQGVGPLAGHTLAVLEIHTPLRDPEDGRILAAAELYYSAKSILEIQARAQMDVWALVGLAGLAVIGILYVLVARVSRTLVSQRANLARNLVASRRLSEENLALHEASERLRLEANLSNERLLAQVGSDLHDGPIQLLALVILRLTKSAKSPSISEETRASLDRSIQLATEVMEELRNISSGLVLPELADLTLREAVDLAIARHEGATGTSVVRKLDDAGGQSSMVVRICAYRVVQEALNNAFWHGDRSEPVVALRSEGPLHLLTIRSGSPRRGAAPSDDRVSLGLSSMRYRVESLGGTLEIEWGAGQVVTIAASIPQEGQAVQASSSSIPSVPVS